MKKIKKIKKIIGIVCIFGSIFNGSNTVNAYVSSHTFFSARPDFQKASPERVSLFRIDLVDECCNGCGGAFQTVFYGSKTTDNGKNKLARFFLPVTCNSCCLNVKEYNEPFEESLTPETAGASADYDKNKDIEARNLNIVTRGGVGEVDTGPFSSKACFSVEQTKIGIGLDYKQRLTLKDDGLTGLWGEISCPIEKVENTVTICEQIQNDGGGPLLTELGLDNSPHVGSVKAAFRQKNWRYGKIDPRCKNYVWGVADVEVLLGYNTYKSECSRLSSYVGVVFPTGNRVTSRTVFEPIVGNNHHFGVIFGSSIHFNMCTRETWNADWYFDMSSRFLFENEEIRSFDLVGKPFSRYKEVYRSPEQANRAFTNGDTFSGTSGINMFTKCVNVQPRYQGIFNQAVNINKTFGCWKGLLELGYSLYVREAEIVTLTDCIDISNVALKSIDGQGQDTMAATIKANYADSKVLFTDPNWNRLLLANCEIDLESMAHPGVISQTLYGTIGFKADLSCPVFGGLGFSYEFQAERANTTIERWMAWGKLGVTF